MFPNKMGKMVAVLGLTADCKRHSIKKKPTVVSFPLSKEK